MNGNENKSNEVSKIEEDIENARIVLDDNIYINSLPQRNRKVLLQERLLSTSSAAFYNSDHNQSLLQKKNENSASSIHENKKDKSYIFSSLNNKNHTFKFDYLDHPADVIIYAKGNDIYEAFVNAAYAFFNYITDLSFIQVKEERSIIALGSDLNDLLFHFLDELLYLYGSEYFIGRHFAIEEFCESQLNEEFCESQLNEEFCESQLNEEFNKIKKFKLICTCFGEIFDIARHTQGNEIKAITMHEMKINFLQNNKNHLKNQQNQNLLGNSKQTNQEENDEVEVYVLVDI